MEICGHLVRKGGLEPPCLSAPPPQDGVSAISPLPHSVNRCPLSIAKSAVLFYRPAVESPLKNARPSGTKLSSSRSAAPAGARVDVFVLEHPGVRMVDVDGMQPGGQCGIDIRAGTVADHPGVWQERVHTSRRPSICCGIFLVRDFDGGEVVAKAGARQLVGLLVGISLGHQDETVT